MKNTLLKSGLVLCFFHALIASASPEAPGEHSADISSGFSAGFDVDSYSNNYGIGVTLGSPYFLNGSSHVQLTADLAWVQGIRNGETQTTWEPFGLFKLGYFSGRFIEQLPIRVYGGGGLVMLTSPSRLSSTAAHFGGFGLTGIEFFVDPSRSKALNLEFGGMGTGAKADQLSGSPIYANGFTISWGYRYYL